jgi:hypothetical protein
MTISPNEPRKKVLDWKLRTPFLLMTLITATIYVYTTITPVLGFGPLPHFIDIGHDSGYSPSSITFELTYPKMPQLSTVEWHNKDPSGSTPVTVTSKPGSPESFNYNIQPGKWWDHTFEHIGTYKYFDKNNPGHKGEIIVEEGK